MIDLVDSDDDDDAVSSTKSSNSGEPNNAVKTQKVSYHIFGQPPSVVISKDGIISISKLAQSPLQAPINKSLEITYQHLYVQPQVHKLNNSSRICVICYHKSNDLHLLLSHYTIWYI